MAVRDISNVEIAERSTALLTATFKDENGATLTSLDSCTLTLYDKSAGSIINSRSATDVLSSVSAGTLSFRLTALDNVVVNTSQNRERHIALLQFTQGAVVGKKEISLLVVNLAQVP